MKSEGADIRVRMVVSTDRVNVVSRQEWRRIPGGGKLLLDRVNKAENDYTVGCLQIMSTFQKNCEFYLCKDVIPVCMIQTCWL